MGSAYEHLCPMWPDAVMRTRATDVRFEGQKRLSSRVGVGKSLR